MLARAFGECREGSTNRSVDHMSRSLLCCKFDALLLAVGYLTFTSSEPVAGATRSSDKCQKGRYALSEHGRSRSESKEEMLNKDLDAHEDKDTSASQFGP